MSIDDRVPQSVQPLTSSIQFVEDGDVVRFSRPETVMVVGAVLTDLANEKLPTGDGDRRVRDDEQDGQPGVTVHVTGVFSGDAYAVQRSHPSYAGTLDADGALRGTTLDRIEQSIIGASNPLLLVPLGTVPLDDPAKNELLLVKVPGAGSCADVLASTALTAEG
jgi:hypothetical protein